MSTTPSPSDATIEQCLQLGHGFHESERATAVEILDKIDHRLVGQPADAVRFDLMVNDRDGRDQKVTLEGHIAGLPTLVATTHDAEVWVAVARTRDEVLRQLNDLKDKRAPHH